MKAWQIILIVIAVLFLGATVTCVGVGAYFVRTMNQVFEGPENIRVEVQSPTQVKPGETFEIKMRVFNDGTAVQVLDSIDVYDEYTEGILIEKIEPAAKSSSHMFGFESYDFQLDIPAGGAVDLTFYAKAIKAGDYRGDFDVCINNEFSFQTSVVRTIVADQLGGSDVSGNVEKAIGEAGEAAEAVSETEVQP